MISNNNLILNTGELARNSIHNVYKKMNSQRTDEIDKYLRSLDIHIKNNQNENRAMDPLENIMNKLSF